MLTTVRRHIAALLVLSAAVIALPAPAPAGELSDEQRREIEALIGDYLLEKPELLVQALDIYRDRQEALKREKVAQRIGELMSRVADNPAFPVSGNPTGDVTVVEFFDYRCGYCKRVFPALDQVMKADAGVRLVYVEFPILGDDSVLAAKAALATWFNWPEHYEALHSALMSTRGTLDEMTVLGEAARLGIDMEDLRAAMGSDAVNNAIHANYALAQELSINGTPAFLIGDKLVPGAIELSDFVQLIAAARNG